MLSKLVGPCLALVLLALSTLAHADTTPTRPYRRTRVPPPSATPAPSQDLTWAGIQLGPNFSTFTHLDSGESGNAEFEVGGFVDWHVQDIWNIETGLRYNSYGVGETEEGVDVNFHSHFIEIPLLLKPMFNAGGWYPYLLVGPSFGFKTGEGVDASGSGTNVSVGTSAVKTFNFAMDFGLGAEVPIQSNFRAFAQFEYSLGLVNVLTNNDENETAKTRAAMLMFGVMAGF